MRGDIVIVEEHHRRAAECIAAAIADDIRSRSRRSVISVAGESGSGKSETAQALADALRARGIESIVLGQDDYFVLPPKSNDAKRREDPAWLGPHREVHLDKMQSNIDAARQGADSVVKPFIDYDANSATDEPVDLTDKDVVIVEGTYVSLLRNVDTRVFIARNRLETKEHRLKRNRGTEATDPFIESVLEIEHKIIAGHRKLADFVITRDYDVIEAE